MANLTVSIDEHVLKRARIAALRRDTSVNAVVREFLERYAGDDEAVAATEEFIARARVSEAGSGPGGRSWRREDLYTDRVER